MAAYGRTCAAPLLDTLRGVLNSPKSPESTDMLTAWSRMVRSKSRGEDSYESRRQPVGMGMWEGGAARRMQGVWVRDRGESFHGPRTLTYSYAPPSPPWATGEHATYRSTTHSVHASMVKRFDVRDRGSTFRVDDFTTAPHVQSRSVGGRFLARVPFL